MVLLLTMNFVNAMNEGNNRNTSIFQQNELFSHFLKNIYFLRAKCSFRFQFLTSYLGPLINRRHQTSFESRMEMSPSLFVLHSSNKYLTCIYPPANFLKRRVDTPVICSFLLSKRSRSRSRSH
uniref:Uncharacterized protein n=1 Tax=Parascaris univalens TaxID=6257 RepID=A0A914ZM33_PARUN